MALATTKRRIHFEARSLFPWKDLLAVPWNSWPEPDPDDGALPSRLGCLPLRELPVPLARES